jgi:site-specific DNA-cytosine methylase
MLQIKEEFKKLIPALSVEEFNQLEANCLAEGIREKIITWDGFIIDGHNRFEIATRWNLEYESESKRFKDENEVKEWMIHNQFGRRNLSNYQRSVLALELESVFSERAKEKQKEAGEVKQKSAEAPIETRKELAKVANVSHDTIAKVKVIEAKAPEEVKAQLRTGEVSINQAYQDIKKEEIRLAKIYEINETKSLEVLEIKDPLAIPYDENIFTLSNKKSEARFGDVLFSLKDEKYYTATTLQRFFHKETGKEFSLREYSYVQTFDNDYKFIGTNQEIKKQIGNAVAPYMGEFITKHLKGKTCGDLFSGCGGFTSGAHRNKIKTLWAIEWEQIAAMSYKMNFPDTKVYSTNIKSIDPLMLDKVDIIIGGPPCQGFSNAGDKNIGKRTFKSDPRNELYKEFLRFVNVLRPNEFIMENVKEIQDVAEQIILDFNEINYEVETKLIKGNEIGMKQNRVRFFFIGKIKK